MKTMTTRIFAMLAFTLLTAMPSMADALSGTLQLNKAYTITSDADMGAFTPTASGVLTITSSGTDKAEVFLGSDYSNQVFPSAEINVNPWTAEFEVTAGTTYYVAAPMIVTAAYTITLTMLVEETKTLQLRSVSPTDGSAYSLGTSDAGQINVFFNHEPSWSTVTVEAGSIKRTVTASSGMNNSIFFETSPVIFDAVAAGMNSGDAITITIDGLCLRDDSAVKYGTDGILTLHYTLKNAPTMLVSTTLGDKFLSYYKKDDAAGRPQFVFSNAIKSIDNVLLKYGSVDADTEGEFYDENLLSDGKVTIDGNVVTLDLTGVVRTPLAMLPKSTTEYGIITVLLSGIKDVNGEFTVSPNQGNMGSVLYEPTIEEVTAVITAEFTPASGSLATTNEIEIYITDYDKISYSGITFTAGTLVKNVAKSDIKVTAEDGGMVLLVPVPAEMKSTTSTVVVSFTDLETADGGDWSKVLTAMYGTAEGITSLTLGKDTDAKIYNVHGQRVNTPARGIIIRNGEKCILK